MIFSVTGKFYNPIQKFYYESPIKAFSFVCKHSMKKLLVTILAVVYLTSTIGATVHFHYCMDKLVAWGLKQEKSDKGTCQYCGMHKSTASKHYVKAIKGCCKDDQKHVKLVDDQKPSVTAFKFAKIPGEFISSVFSDHSFEYVSSIHEEYPVNHAPPRQSGIPIFILNCVYRI